MLDEMKLNFIVEFEHYLRTVQKIGHNTSMKYAKDLKQVMKYGVILQYLQTKPFELFQCSYKKVKREFLDQDELDMLYKKEFVILMYILFAKMLRLNLILFIVMEIKNEVRDALACLSYMRNFHTSLERR